MRDSNLIFFIFKTFIEIRNVALNKNPFIHIHFFSSSISLKTHWSDLDPDLAKGLDTDSENLDYRIRSQWKVCLRI